MRRIGEARSACSISADVADMTTSVSAIKTVRPDPGIAFAADRIQGALK